MSAFDAIFTDAMKDIGAIYGAPAVYTNSVGASVNCTVYLEYDVETYPSGFEVGFQEQTTTLEVLLSETGEVPAKGAVFMAEGKTWVVKEWLENDEIFVKVAVYENRN